MSHIDETVKVEYKDEVNVTCAVTGEHVVVLTIIEDEPFGLISPGRDAGVHAVLTREQALKIATLLLQAIVK